MLFLIVARSDKAIYEALLRHLGCDGRVDVILDRRFRDRRQRQISVPFERRCAKRRRRADEDVRVRRMGLAIVDTAASHPISALLGRGPLARFS